MPRTCKRSKQLVLSAERARTSKIPNVSSDISEEPDVINNEQNSSQTDNEPGTSSTTNYSSNNEDCVSDTSDTDFDPENIPDDLNAMMENFCETWVHSLDQDTRTSLGLFLLFTFILVFQHSVIKAAEYAGMLVQRSDRTVRLWRKSFFDNGGEVPESQQGKYTRSGVLWASEDLNDKACKFVRSHCNIKGHPNMRIFDFCSWANNELLPSSTLEPGFPRQISIETARRWLHQLGFEYLSPKKGSFVDGHERDDVVEYRKNFLRRMVTLGFLHRDNAPTSTAAESLPKDLEEPSPQLTAKTVIFLHDETTFQANDDQTRQWGAKGTQVVMQKSKGRGIMVSDFVSEDGFLCLSDEIKSISDPNLKRYEGREQIEYGENADGYWTNERFMNQMEVAVKLAEIKYPKDKGFRHCWVFDHSSCHAARSDDALDVSRMNVKPGGKQPKMRDTIWNGRVQKMNFSIGVPKGMKLILDEINTG